MSGMSRAGTAAVLQAALAAITGAGLVGFDRTLTNPVGTIGDEAQLLRAHRPGVSNYLASSVKRWLLSLAAIRNNSASASVAFIGDSTTMGYNATLAGYTDGRAFSYPTGVQQIFNEGGIPAQSDSFFGDANAAGAYAAYDPRVTLGSGITHASGTSLGGFYFILPAASGPLTFNPGNGNTFDRIDVYVLEYPGAGTVAVDVGGATLTTINANATRAVTKVTVNCPAGSSLVNLTNASGSVSIVGMNVWSSTTAGVAILNMGWSGSTSGDWARTTFAEDPANSIGAVSPEAAVICLGINDWVAGTAVATTKANLATLIGKLQPYTAVYLAVPIPSKESVVPLATQEQYRDAMVDLSRTLKCPILDMIERRESWTDSDAFNLYADNFHGTTFGNLDMASAVADILMRP